MARWAYLFFAVFLVLIPGTAAAVTFQLAGSQDVEDVDGFASLSLTLDGITATLTANVGVLNTTMVSGFGINAPNPPGSPLDEPSQVDGITANETVTIQFDRNVTFDQLVLALFTPSALDSATLTIDGFAPIPLVPQTSALDTYNFTVNNSVAVGQSVVLAWVAGNGFSFDNFSVTAVPEPATAALLGIGVAAVVAAGAARRRARK